MDGSFLAGVVGVLAIVFWLLSRWQRRLDRSERERVMAEIRESKSRGTHQATTQYPQIKPFLCIGCASCVEACPEDGVLGMINGIAHVINGSRCVGHARCQEVCPVGAITVGLGDIKTRPDIPQLTNDLESSVPNIFIAGELGGIALIRHAVDQGTRAIDVIAERTKTLPRRDRTGAKFDVAIVGAGPAGLSAALRAKELGIDAVAISQDDIGGTIRKYPRRKLTLVQTVDIPLYGKLAGREYTKEDLVALWDELIQRHQLPVRTGITFLGVQRHPSGFELKTSAGPLHARFVILALGRRGMPRKLGVTGEDREKVLYQLIDTASYQHQRLLVVGGGDSAIEAATGLANQPGNIVTLSYRKEQFTRLKARNEERIRDYIARGRVKVFFSSEVVAISQDAVELSTNQGNRRELLRLPNDYVFIFAGGEPPFPLLKEMGIRFGASPNV